MLLRKENCEVSRESHIENWIQFLLLSFWPSSTVAKLSRLGNIFLCRFCIIWMVARIFHTMQLIQHFLKNMQAAILQLSKAEVSTFQNSWKPQSKLSKHFVKKNLTSLKCNFPSIISSHTEFPGTISQQAVILNHLYVVKTLRRHKSTS